MKVIQYISFVIIIILLNHPAFSQGKTEISAGAGFPELINLRVRYGGNFKIGLCQSVLPFYDPPIPLGPTVAEVYYHFAGKSTLNKEPLWYLLGGIGCFWDTPGGFYGEEGIHFCLYPRFGRSFNLSKNNGINFDAGVVFPFSDVSGYMVYPSLSINLFFRL